MSESSMWETVARAGISYSQKKEAELRERITELEEALREVGPWVKEIGLILTEIGETLPEDQAVQLARLAGKLQGQWEHRARKLVDHE